MSRVRLALAGLLILVLAACGTKVNTETLRYSVCLTYFRVSLPTLTDMIERDLLKGDQLGKIEKSVEILNVGCGLDAEGTVIVDDSAGVSLGDLVTAGSELIELYAPGGLGHEL